MSAWRVPRTIAATGLIALVAALPAACAERSGQRRLAEPQRPTLRAPAQSPPPAPAAAPAPIDYAICEPGDGEAAGPPQVVPDDARAAGPGRPATLFVACGAGRLRSRRIAIPASRGG